MAPIEVLCVDYEFKSSCFKQLDMQELEFANNSKVQIHYKKWETIAKQGSFVTHPAICSIERDVLEQLVMKNGSFANTIIKTVNRETHHLRSKMNSLTQKPINGRLSDTLLKLSGDVFGTSVFPYKLSCNDLEEHSGISMMSAVRTMQDFIRNGYMDEQQGKIRIMDMGALEGMSQEN